MATFAVAISFTVDAKDYEEAHKIAEQIGTHAVIDGEHAHDSTIIDVELLEDDEGMEDDSDYEAL